MPNYECTICKIKTTQKANYLRHLQTKKHKQMEETAESQPRENFACEYCEQKFSFKQSMYRHIKYRCTKNKDEDLKELVRLMNLQLQQKDKEIDTKQKQIDKLMTKLEININTTNIQNNFILSYDKTDTSHLTDKDFESYFINFILLKMNMLSKNQYIIIE